LYIKRTNNNFTSEISVDKEKYIEGEDITVSVKVKNISNKTDSLAQFNSYDVMISLGITNEKGENLVYKGAITDFARIKYTVFKPGETKGYSLQILEDYGNEKLQKDYSLCAMHYYFPQGSYTLQYNDGNSSSNTIKFIVEAPVGNESDRWDELKSIYTIPTPKGQGVKEKAWALMGFAQKNKESVYSENAFYIASLDIIDSGKGWLINDDYIERCKWFIDTYPNSIYINGVVWDAAFAVAHLTKNKYIVDNFLDKIIVEYPNTDASINAKNFLNYNFPTW